MSGPNSLILIFFLQQLKFAFYFNLIMHNRFLFFFFCKKPIHNPNSTAEFIEWKRHDSDIYTRHAYVHGLITHMIDFDVDCEIQLDRMGSK
jgi:hypothetical protein